MSGRQMSAGGSRESSPNKTWGYCGKSDDDYDDCVGGIL